MGWNSSENQKTFFLFFLCLLRMNRNAIIATQRIRDTCMILTYSANAFVFLSKHERLLLKIFCEYHIYCCLFRTTISQKTAHKNRLNVEEIELGMNYRLTLTVVEL